jgi:hypothetical protein
MAQPRSVSSTSSYVCQNEMCTGFQKQFRSAGAFGSHIVSAAHKVGEESFSGDDEEEEVVVEQQQEFVGGVVGENGILLYFNC